MRRICRITCRSLKRSFFGAMRRRVPHIPPLDQPERDFSRRAADKDLSRLPLTAGTHAAAPAGAGAARRWPCNALAPARPQSGSRRCRPSFPGNRSNTTLRRKANRSLRARSASPATAAAWARTAKICRCGSSVPVTAPAAAAADTADPRPRLPTARAPQWSYPCTQHRAVRARRPRCPRLPHASGSCVRARTGAHGDSDRTKTSINAPLMPTPRAHPETALPDRSRHYRRRRRRLSGRDRCRR